MKKICELRKKINQGKVIWIQSPGEESGLFFVRKLLNGLGVQDQEITYLCASQFVDCFRDGFATDFLKNTKMLLVGGLEKLDSNTELELRKNLALFKDIKYQFGVSLVLVSQSSPCDFNCDQQVLVPHVFQLFDEHHPIEINEKIHDLIENACVEFNKQIWSLSPEAAEYLELILLKRGEAFLKRLIFRAVCLSKNRKLTKKDIGLAHQYPFSFGSSAEFI